MSLPIHLQAAPRPRDLQPLAGELTLRRGRLHEICGPSRLRLAAGVMARSTGPVVWIRPGWWPERLNAAGLQPLADPARLVLVRADRDEAVLWAAEEALRAGIVPLVVVETAAPPGLTPVRRLHLAAGAGAGGRASRRGGSPAGADPHGRARRRAGRGKPLAPGPGTKPGTAVGRHGRLDADAAARPAGTPRPLAAAANRRRARNADPNIVGRIAR